MEDKELLMEENNDDIVTLISANGEQVDFLEIAGIAYKGNSGIFH